MGQGAIWRMLGVHSKPAEDIRLSFPSAFPLTSMKTRLFNLLALTTLLVTFTISSTPAREYSNDRGGSAYVGKNGVAAKGANGNTAAYNRNTGNYATGTKNANGSTTYHGSNGGTAYAGQNGYAYHGANGYYGAGNYHGSSVSGNSYYHSSIPSGYVNVYHGGYQCHYVGGVYYRPVYVNGARVYVVVL